MNRSIKLTACLVLGLLAAPGLASADDKDKDAASSANGGDWVSLFDGKSLKGWTTADDTTGKWEVVDGAITCTGPASHLFSPRGDYKNFRYRCEIKINDGGNSGQYVRTAKGPGFPKGYEAQVNSTQRDPVKTGSLYNFAKVLDVLVPPDTWFTQEVEAVGDRIVDQGQRQDHRRLHRPQAHLHRRLFRLPAPRPDLQGPDPQGRGDRAAGREVIFPVPSPLRGKGLG